MKHHFNNHVVLQDHLKKNPSGVAPNVAMALSDEYHGINCLQPVDTDLVMKLKEELGDDVVRFVSKEYAVKARVVFDTLNTALAVDNVWLVFQAIMPVMYSIN